MTLHTYIHTYIHTYTHTYDNTIIICPADKGKAVVVEDRDVYMAKTQHQIHEGDYVLSNKSENDTEEIAHEVDGSAYSYGNKGFQQTKKACSYWSCDGIDGVAHKSSQKEFSRKGVCIADR